MSAIAMLSPKEFIAMLASASPEERAEIGALFHPVSTTKKTAKQAAPAEERPPVDLSTRPEMPEDPELDEDFCHGRVYKSFKSDESAAASFRAAEEAAGRPVPTSEKSFYLPGFGTKIYEGAQCSKKASGSGVLCSDCSNHMSEYEAVGSKGHGTGKKAWYGVIGEAPPADAHFCGSTWAQKKYDTEFGLSPSSASRSSGSKKAPKEAKEAKEVKATIPPKPTVPKPAKKAAPPAAAAVVPPAAEKKPVQVIADDLTLNPVLDCFINSEGVCFYADLDETTLEPIPDMSRIIGSIPKGMDPEEATEKDFKKAEEE
jgi:predicted flap endonuclease-1-like 5' DNA nuclease